MKNIKAIITGLAIAALCGATGFTGSAFATSYQVGFTGSSTFDDTTTWNLQVSGVSGGSLYNFAGTLGYDSSKIEVVPTAASGITMTNGGRMLLEVTDITKPISSSANLLTLTIKNKALTTNQSTTISFTGITASDGDTDIATTNASKTITWTKVEANQNNNSNTSSNTSNNSNSTPSSSNSSSNSGSSSTSSSSSSSSSSNSSAPTTYNRSASSSAPTATSTEATNSDSTSDTTKESDTTKQNSTTEAADADRTKVQGVADEVAATGNNGIVWLIVAIVSAVVLVGLIIWLILAKKKQKQEEDQQPLVQM